MATKCKLLLFTVVSLIIDTSAISCLLQVRFVSEVTCCLSGGMSYVVLQVVRVDLSSIKCCCSGPKRPLDRVDINNVKTDFLSCLQDGESPRVSYL